jgi:hypothetical protein
LRLFTYIHNSEGKIHLINIWILYYDDGWTKTKKQTNQSFFSCLPPLKYVLLMSHFIHSLIFVYKLEQLFGIINVCLICVDFFFLNLFVIHLKHFRGIYTFFFSANIKRLHTHYDLNWKMKLLWFIVGFFNINKLAGWVNHEQVNENLFFFFFFQRKGEWKFEIECK